MDVKLMSRRGKKMKKLVFRKFLPINHLQEAFLDYHQATQGTMSIENFTGYFDQLHMRCAIEEQIIARLALKLEKHQKNWHHALRSRIVKTPKSTNFNSKIKSTPGPVLGQRGTLNTSGSMVIWWLRCQGVGHMFRDRPNKHVVTLVDSLPQFNESTEVEDEVEDKQDLVKNIALWFMKSYYWATCHYYVSTTFNVADMNTYEGPYDKDDNLDGGALLDGEDDAGASIELGLNPSMEPDPKPIIWTYQRHGKTAY
ncbi:hypothetical protein E3N88_44861 [Mikania micrantha]|uniref:Retrotransposon gag domain-containing protein n=1 Tax=Mikania micrantha TaxID=192012 RepID=A0A5N6LAU7_9ASTR|nr:hypothetical protein E3N88_44861 [Mikania micrantha]